MGGRGRGIEEWVMGEMEQLLGITNPTVRECTEPGPATCGALYGFKMQGPPGAPGWLQLSIWGSGRDLTVREFKPHVGLCADSSEPGVCRGFCVCLSLCPSLARTLCVSLSQKYMLRNKFKKMQVPVQTWSRMSRQHSIQPSMGPF